MYWMPFFSDKFDFKDATAQWSQQQTASMLMQSNGCFAYVSATLHGLVIKHIAPHRRAEESKRRVTLENNKSYYDHANLWLEILMWKHFCLKQNEVNFWLRARSLILSLLKSIYANVFPSNGVLHSHTHPFGSSEQLRRAKKRDICSSAKRALFEKPFNFSWFTCVNRVIAFAVYS